jgi:hypothetical protein
MTGAVTKGLRQGFTPFDVKDDHVAERVYSEFPQADEDLVRVRPPSQPQQIPNLVGPNGS